MPTASRSPNVGDLMIVIVAVAMGLTSHRFTERLSGEMMTRAIRDCDLKLYLDESLQFYAVPALIGGTLASALLSLRHQRPIREGLAKLPGVSAGISASMVLAIMYVFAILEYVTNTAPASSPIRASGSTPPIPAGWWRGPG